MRMFDFRRSSEPQELSRNMHHNHNTMECVIEWYVPGKSFMPYYEMRLTQVERENLIRDLQAMNPYPK